MFEKKVFQLCICFGFLTNSLLIARDVYQNEKTLKIADSYYQATVFDRAAIKYLEIIPQLEKNSEIWSYAAMRLALSYYYSGQYEKLVDFFEQFEFSDIHNPRVEKPLVETLYLQAVALNKIKNHEKAISKLQAYLSKRGQFALLHEQDAQFELGLSYFLSEKYNESKEIFKSFPSNDRAIFYLAYQAIVEEKFAQAKEIISKLLQKKLSDELYFAVTFLKGEISYRQKDYIHAIEYFEKIKQPIGGVIADWYLDSLHHLGKSYLNLATDDSENRRTNFNKAEEVFSKYLNLSQNDNVYLALGKTYLMMGQLLGDVEAFDKLERLLTKKDIFSTVDAKYQALLLRAEAKKDYSERKLLFHQLTRMNNLDNSYLSHSLYLQGLNEFEEGQKQLQEEKSKLLAKKHLENAVVSLESAFKKLYPDDILLAAMANKYQIEALFLLRSKKTLKKGLEIIDTLLNDYRHDLFAALKNQDEIYYLQGAIAAYLADLENEAHYVDIAKKSLNHVIVSYPKGKFFLESTYLLASVYYRSEAFVQAEKKFVDFANLSSTDKAGDALFFAALAAEKQKKDPLITKEYRKRVFENYPQSTYADEAYFCYYSYSEYMLASNQVIEHLKKLEEKFPNSPFVVNAHYLIGLINSNNIELADGYYKMVETTFDKLVEKGAISDKRYNYFNSIRYQAMQDRALNKIGISQDYKGAKRKKLLEDAEEILYKIYLEFDKTATFNQIVEKNSYHLARCYILQEKSESADKIFTSLLEKYNGAKITRGYYLSRLWYERGSLAFNRKDYEGAIEHFLKANDAAKGKSISSDELLDLWIQEGLCYLFLNDLDQAMLILSKVINYDAASSMRIKAMYLRFLVYEKQGRAELAKKQLEATAKKGGSWAKKAKDKLEENYVLK